MNEDERRAYWRSLSGSERVQIGWEMALQWHFDNGGTVEDLKLKRGTPIVVKRIVKGGDDQDT